MTSDKYILAKKQIRQVLDRFQKAYELNNEIEFMEAMRKIGINDEDPRFLHGLKTFRALKSGNHPETSGKKSDADERG
jgi:hypothetical protein